MKLMQAINECLGCGHKWMCPPGAFGTPTCPSCGHVYWRWTNYNTTYGSKKR